MTGMTTYPPGGPPRPALPQPGLARRTAQALALGLLLPGLLQLGLLASGYRAPDPWLRQAGMWLTAGPLAGAWLPLAALTLLAMLGEGLWARHALRRRRSQLERAPLPLLYSVRLPQVPAAAAPPDRDLFRAVAGALAGHGRRSGPWCAWLLQGQPDQPVGWAVGIGGPDSSSAGQAAANLLATLHGVAPQGSVAPQDDPLSAALSDGRRLLWRRWTLALPSHYPIRLPDDPRHTPLAGLASALRPFGGVLYSESQLVVEAATGRGDWSLRRGWRGAATALRLRLEARQDLALRADTSALEAKLDGVPYLVSLRVAVVTEAAAEADGRRMLRQIDAALAAYQLRVGSVAQRFVAGPLLNWRVGDPLCPRDLALVLRRAPQPTRSLPLLLPVAAPFWPEPVWLSSAELAGLWHLPAAALGPLARWQSCRVLPPPPQAFAEVPR